MLNMRNPDYYLYVLESRDINYADTLEGAHRFENSVCKS